MARSPLPSRQRRSPPRASINAPPAPRSGGTHFAPAPRPGSQHRLPPTATTHFPGFTPYQPPPFPSGSYDPALDAQLRASQRGLGDTESDIATANERGTVDYGFQKGQIEQARSREEADYQRSVGMLTRSFGLLANRQRQQASAAGVTSPGIALLAAARRAENQGIQQSALDTTRGRSLQDFDTQLGQLALNSAPPGPGNPLGGRSFQDRTTQLTRAQREAAAFGLDIKAEEGYQAGLSGYVAPAPGEPGGQPLGEHIDAQGNHYRVVTRDGITYRLAPSGQLTALPPARVAFPPTHVARRLPPRRQPRRLPGH